MNYVCVYSKPPIPGKTKSRLARKIGNKEAASLAKAMLQDICCVAAAVDNVEFQVWHPPEYSRADFKGIIPLNYTFRSQIGDDLGERMSNTFHDLLSIENTGLVVIIGSDCIAHSSSSINTSISALTDTDVVIQPSVDGGYVLIGQSTWVPEIFENIEWGTDKVMEQTKLQIRNHRVNHKYLPTSFDIDTDHDIERLIKFVKDDDRHYTRLWLSNNNLI